MAEGPLVIPPTEEMLMTDPPLSCIPDRHTSWVQWMRARMLVWWILSMWLNSMFMSGPMYGLAAALLTRMSTGPNWLTVASTAAAAASGSPVLAACQAT